VTPQLYNRKIVNTNIKAYTQPFPGCCKKKKFILDKPIANRLVIITYISLSEEEEDDRL